MSTLIVHTKGAVYEVDREGNRWKRTEATTAKEHDGEWVSGGFTVGEPGQGCFAHFIDHPGGAIGRRTSRVLRVEERPE